MRFLKWHHSTRDAQKESMEALPLWLENAVAAAGMTAYAEGLDFVGKKSATENNEQQHVTDPPGKVH